MGETMNFKNLDYRKYSISQEINIVSGVLKFKAL